MVRKNINKIPELIIFDWSGVLSDDRMPVFAANMKMLEDYGKLTMNLEGWLSNTEMTIVRFIHKRGIKATAGSINKKYKKYYNESIKSGITPKIMPSAKRVLRHLRRKNIRLAVLSSHPHKNLKKEMAEYGLSRYFNEVVGEVKDKVESLRKICKDLDTDPGRSAYVGDMISDIQSAKQVGATSIAVSTGYHSKKRLKNEKPDYLFGKLSDLSKLF
ncbi:MAG: HAD family hydrolase [Parcubacteria group bacterium]|jgi:phosphoglycolate phosphatase